MIGRDTPWGEPASGPPDLEVHGGDADLAAVVGPHPGALVRFVPDDSSDLARAIGLAAGPAPAGVAVPIDALELDGGAHAVNAVVLGSTPGTLHWVTRTVPMRVLVDGREVYAGRATTVVVASGQFLEGDDAVPRGHPGDGRVEVQVYGLHRSERRPMRARLPRGEHVPHPRITAARGKQVEVEVEQGELALTVDRVPAGTVRHLSVAVLPSAVRLLL